MTPTTISRPAQCERPLVLPDETRVARALEAPQAGPRLLFFSGGSALNGISRRLKHYTHNSVHLITPFDSGGSSQELRVAFDMPAVGDLRSRLMALADEGIAGQPDVYALFSHRLPKSAEAGALRAEVAGLRDGTHPLVTAIVAPMRARLLDHLARFFEAVPEGFDYRNASIGNLILAGGYLGHGRALEPVLEMMSEMVDVRGEVRAVVDGNFQIGVTLADGRQVLGQRALTGKEVAPLDSPIAQVFVVADATAGTPVEIALPLRNRDLIGQAEVICYPPGSLYSSVVANLLPQGVGLAVAQRPVPKVYLPSLGHDPEALGHSLADQVAAILKPLLRDAGPGAHPCDLMTHVLCDLSVPEGECDSITHRFSIPVLRLDLRAQGRETYDTEKVARVLISLACED